MKRQSAMLTMSAVLMSLSVMAQKTKIVPAAVASALKAKYPQATKVTWEKEKGNFEANRGGKSGEDMAVTFTPAGVFVEQVEAIEPTTLPAPALAYIKAHYAGKKVSEAGRVTHATGKTTYEAEIKMLEVVFDDKGNFMQESKEND